MGEEACKCRFTQDNDITSQWSHITSNSATMSMYIFITYNQAKQLVTWYHISFGSDNNISFLFWYDTSRFSLGPPLSKPAFPHFKNLYTKLEFIFLSSIMVYVKPLCCQKWTSDQFLHLFLSENKVWCRLAVKLLIKISFYIHNMHVYQSYACYIYIHYRGFLWCI